MERLTVRQSESEEAYLSCEKCGKKAFSECWDEMDCQKTAIDRLAAIEDILGDEYDLNRLLQLVSQRMTMREDVSERMKLVGNMPIDRLRELVEADQGGRCVVLPCKPGTPVYRIVWHIGCAQMDDESYRMVSPITAPFTLDMVGEFGKTVFLTREAAEAALKGE